MCKRWEVDALVANPLRACGQSPFQRLGEDKRLVVLGVPGRVDEGECFLARPAPKLRKAGALWAKLLEVAPAELIEALGPVPEPSPQLGARRKVAVPIVEFGPLAREAPRPEAIDEHAVAVRGFGRVVCSLQADVQGGSIVKTLGPKRGAQAQHSDPARRLAGEQHRRRVGAEKRARRRPARSSTVPATASGCLAIIASAMAQLLVRDIEADVVSELKIRAARHGRSAEEEHRQILREALRPRGSTKSLKELLLEMPDVGEDRDFERPVDRGRSVEL